MSIARGLVFLPRVISPLSLLRAQSQSTGNPKLQATANKILCCSCWPVVVDLPSSIPLRSVREPSRNHGALSKMVPGERGPRMSLEEALIAFLVSCGCFCLLGVLSLRL